MDEPTKKIIVLQELTLNCVGGMEAMLFSEMTAICAWLSLAMSVLLSPPDELQTTILKETRKINLFNRKHVSMSTRSKHALDIK